MFVTFTTGGDAVHVVAGHVTHFHASGDGGTTIWLVGGRDLKVDQAVADVARRLADGRGTPRPRIEPGL
jgi:hypothetical protein